MFIVKLYHIYMFVVYFDLA